MGKVRVKGERYLGLDDTAFRAGAGGSKPLDSFVDQVLRSDLLWLLNRGSQVSWTPLSSGSADDDLVGHRPHASVDWSSILCLPWLVQPGLKAIELSSLGRVSVASGTTPTLAHRLRLLGLADGSQQTYPPGGLGQGDLKLELAEPAPRRLVTSLVWEVKSQVGDDIVAQIAGDGAMQSLNRLDAGSSNATFYSDPRTGTHPSASDLGLQVTSDESLEGTPSQHYDHLYTRNGGTWAAPWNGRKMTVRSVSVLRPPGRLTRRSISYLQTRGCEIRELYDGERFVRPRERYRARQPVDARDTLGHLHAARTAVTRARCRWVGPVGERITAEYARALWPSGYVRRHPRAQHTGGDDPNVLFWAPVLLGSKNPKLTVLLNVLAIQAVDYVAADRDDLDAKCGTASWQVSVQIKQYQDGHAIPIDLTSEILSDPAELRHYPTDSSGQWTALLQERVRLVEDGIDGYTYKEGQLYEEDYSLLQRLELSLDVPFDPAVDSRPILVRVGVRYIPGSQTRQLEQGGPVGSISEASDLALVCVGATIWEEPQL